MGLTKRDWLILGGGLGFLAILAVSFSVAFHAYWSYELAALITAVVFIALFIFLPRVFKDVPPKAAKLKLVGKINRFFSTKENQTRFFYCASAVLLHLLFIVRFKSGLDYLENVPE